MGTVKAYAATAADKPLTPYEFEYGPLGREDVEIKMHYCGLCHSDLSMIENQWQMTQYPMVPGHEIAGEIIAVGDSVKNLTVGQKVGLGWFSGSCMHCRPCLSGDHNMCETVEQTIVGREGGFADRVRCHWSWATPLPDGIDLASVGPMFCGGITVFNPIVQFDVRPTERVGVVGVGGLGHIALQFLNKWGCHVTALSSSPDKTAELKKLGAHAVVKSRDESALEAIAGTLDFLLVTVNVTLNWPLYLNTLRQRGRMHFVGAVMEPLGLPVFPMLVQQREVSASPLGSPKVTRDMLEFCVRHDIKPQVEYFKMSQVNDALDHLRAGKARYRIVLENDF